jgi:hypothetical protein
MDITNRTQRELPQPLKRLNTYNGLSINAELWETAHDYHQNRQDIYFQSLFEPGIVSGLGIQILADPPKYKEPKNEEYEKKNRWIRIQPGVAIDTQGNPIIIEAKSEIIEAKSEIIEAKSDQSKSNEAEDLRNFFIETKSIRPGSETIYIVLSFAEPNFEEKDIASEKFRIDQTTEVPDENQIELCRFKLQVNSPDQLELKYPQNVFAPGLNELDLRHRKPVRPVPREFVQIGVLKDAHQSLHEGLNALSKSLTVLYPTMGSQIISVEHKNIGRALSLQCDVLCLDIDKFSDDGDFLQNILAFIEAKGVVIFDVHKAIDGNSQIQKIHQKLSQSWPLESWQDLKSKNHFILNTPFQFGRPLCFNEVDSQLYLSHQLIWLKGALKSAWSGAGGESREEIRASQELGINLLRYIWKFRQLS